MAAFSFRRRRSATHSTRTTISSTSAS